MKLIDADNVLSTYRKWLTQLTAPEDAGDRNGVETCICELEDAPAVNAVILPCNIGDKVYRIAKGRYPDYKPFVQELTVTEISWKFKNCNPEFDLGFAIIADGIRYKFSSIGKSVFLTREEAEASIKGGNQND